MKPARLRDRAHYACRRRGSAKYRGHLHEAAPNPVQHRCQRRRLEAADMSGSLAFRPGRRGTS